MGKTPSHLKKKVEFSKLVFIYMSLLNTIVIAFSMYMIWKTQVLDPLAYLIPSVGAEVASGTAFYYWKAKAENVVKIKKQYDIPIEPGDITANM